MNLFHDYKHTQSFGRVASLLCLTLAGLSVFYAPQAHAITAVKYFLIAGLSFYGVSKAPECIPKIAEALVNRIK